MSEDGSKQPENRGKLCGELEMAYFHAYPSKPKSEMQKRAHDFWSKYKSDVAVVNQKISDLQHRRARFPLKVTQDKGKVYLELQNAYFGAFPEKKRSDSQQEAQRFWKAHKEDLQAVNDEVSRLLRLKREKFHMSASPPKRQSKLFGFAFSKQRIGDSTQSTQSSVSSSQDEISRQLSSAGSSESSSQLSSVGSGFAFSKQRIGDSTQSTQSSVSFSQDEISSQLSSVGSSESSESSCQLSSAGSEMDHVIGLAQRAAASASQRKKLESMRKAPAQEKLNKDLSEVNDQIATLLDLRTRSALPNSMKVELENLQWKRRFSIKL